VKLDGQPHMQQRWRFVVLSRNGSQAKDAKLGPHTSKVRASGGMAGAFYQGKPGTCMV